jgi:hypothetical protein
VNPYAGIDPEDSTPGWQSKIPTFEWVFRTGDNTPPTPVALFPEVGSDYVSKETDLSIVFDENIWTSCITPSECTTMPGYMPSLSDYLGNKGFYIYSNDGKTPGIDFGNFVEFIPYTDASRVKYSGTDIYNGLINNKVTIDPKTVFQRNLTYYVRVSGGLYCDDFGNKWAGIRDNSWYFTITNDVAPVIEWAQPALYGEANAPETIPAEDNGYVITDLVMSFVDEVDQAAA